MVQFAHHLQIAHHRPPSLHHAHISASTVRVDVSRAASSLSNQGIQLTPKILHRLRKKEAWKARRRERKEKEKAERVASPVWYEWPEEDGLTERGKLAAIQVEEDRVDDFLCFVREQNPEKRLALSGSDDCADVDVGGSVRAKKRKGAKENVRPGEEEVHLGSCEDGQTFDADHRHRHGSAEIEINFENDDSDVGNVARVRNSKDTRDDFGLKPDLQGASCRDYAQELELRHLYSGGSDVYRDYETGKESHFYGSHAHDGRIASSTDAKQDHTPVNEGESSERKENANFDCDSTSGINKELVTTSQNVEYNPRQMRENHRDDRPLIDDLRKHTGEAALSANAREEFNYHDSPQHVDCGNSTDYACPLASDSSAEIRVMLSQTESLSLSNLMKNAKETHMYQVPKETHVEKFLDDEIGQLPKMPEVWKKGVGIVKAKKPPFSKEVKDRIIARRRGDYSMFYEPAEEAADDDDGGMDGERSSRLHFDGRAALLEDKRIQKLAERLNRINYWTSKLHFSKMMHSGKMKLTEDRVLRIVELLGEWGNWRRAMQVVQWVHKRQHYQFHKSKFILTTLISVLGKAQRPIEALNVFSVMRESYSSYPDMPAYHAIAVVLGQAGYLKELLELIQSLKKGPPKPIKFIPVLNWESYLQPDVIVYNAVLNACIPNKEWAGVSWTWDQMEMEKIRPNSATFGLMIEAMVKAGNFDQAIRFYKRMERAGFPANAQTYKCLVETFGKAKKTDEAIELVKVMETSGTVGTASVYYALACSLCFVGRVKEALFQVRKMQDSPSRKPDVITFTGLIRTCGAVGRVEDATFLFRHMQHTCAPNVRTCNEMIKIYGRNRMFEEAKMIYESVKEGSLESCIFFDKTNRLCCDSFTFELMLKAAAISHQWAYFHCVYKSMTSQGFFLSGKTSLWVMMKVAKLKQVHLVDDMIQQLQKAGEVPDRCLYDAQIFACIQSQCFQRASGYLDAMVKEGHEVTSTIEAVQKRVPEDIWDDFLKEAGSWGVVLS